MKIPIAEHKACAQKHFNKRAKERLDEELNRHDAKILIDNIRRNKYGDGWPVQHTEDRRWYFVEYHDNHFWILYDKVLKRLVTCLDGYTIPKSVWQSEQEKFVSSLYRKKR